MKPLRIMKKPYVCHDGPWAGQTLTLNSPQTVYFKSFMGYGRYVYNPWTKMLHWELSK